MKKFLVFLATWLMTFTTSPSFAQQGSTVPQPTRSAGRFFAASYGKWAVHTTSSTAAGAATINVDNGAPFAGSGFGGGVSDSGRFINAFQNTFPFGGGFIKVSVDSGSSNEVVTLTGSTSCVAQNNQNLGTGQLSTCSLTASSFANAHGQGAFVFSGTAGLQEAINDAANSGGGVVVVDPGWSLLGGTTAMLAAASVAQNVVIEDDRAGAPTYWYPLAGATTIATPATLTNSTAGFSVAGANLTGGAYTGSSTYIACVSYVDIMGQEGPCSATFTIATSGSATTDQIGFVAPVASAGAVGYTIYITLASGSYVSAYKVPLVTQPSVVGAYPVANGVCTLTTVETITPACSVANSTYGTVAANAIVSALTLNTSPIEPETTIISTTSIYVPQPGGRTTYTYAPGGAMGASGTTIASSLAFPITAAAATTVPAVLGTVNLAPNVMNVVGKKLRICGIATTTASAATIVDIQFQWDAMGQNTAGKGVLIGDLTGTPSSALATAGHVTFCQDFMTTVASASATGGTIQETNGFGGIAGLTTVGSGALGDSLAGASAGGVGSLNLGVDARINIIYLHTTATDGAGWILQNVTAQLL